jgi:hypothetical protein
MPRAARSSASASDWTASSGSCTALLYGSKKAGPEDRNRPVSCVDLRGFEPLTPSMRTRSGRLPYQVVFLKCQVRGYLQLS